VKKYIYFKVLCEFNWTIRSFY